MAGSGWIQRERIGMEIDMVKAPTKTLLELREILGPPSPLLLASMKTPEAIAAYQDQGRQMASAKVLVDAERILGLAYATWEAATEEQKDLLVGFSESFLAVAVDQALALRQATEVLDSAEHSDKVARSASSTSVALLAKPALILRDQAVTVLRTIAGPSEALKARIAAATGDASTPENLASGLERVAALGNELLKSEDPTVVELAKATRVSEAYFERVTTAAVELRAAIEAARPRLTSAKVSQGDVDVLDGLVLRLLSDLIHSFAAAQDIDGTIPSLVPIATRRLLASRTKRRPAGPSTPPG
jgi:hypothetical protein